MDIKKITLADLDEKTIMEQSGAAMTAYRMEHPLPSDPAAIESYLDAQREYINNSLRVFVANLNAAAEERAMMEAVETCVDVAQEPAEQLDTTTDTENGQNAPEKGEGKKEEKNMESTVKYTYEEKHGTKYEQTYECTDAEQVYNDLTHELISKKINGCTWIRAIKRTPLYNGYQRITITYDHGGRRIYTVSDH